MEQALEQIGSELGINPDQIIPTIRTLPKAQEVDGLRVQIAELISENDRLQTQVADRNRRAEAAEAQTLVAVALASAAEVRATTTEVHTTAAEEARIRVEAESTKWHGVSRKFFDSFGFPGDVVTKARIFDECMKKLGYVGSKGSTHAGGLQRAGGKPAEGDPVSLPARRLRARGRPIRAAPGIGFGAISTGSVFSAHYNHSGPTDRSTIRLNSSTGGDTFSTGGSINAQHPRSHSAGANSGLPEYR